MDEALGRIAASASILVAAAVVIHLGCLRASTIYFFELDSTTVYFLTPGGALFFSLLLSALLVIVYFSTKRHQALEAEREADEKQRQLGIMSSPRKTSRAGELRPIFETSQGDGDELLLSRSEARLRRILSNIEEDSHLQRESQEASEAVTPASSSSSDDDLAEEANAERSARLILPPEQAPKTEDVEEEKEEEEKELEKIEDEEGDKETFRSRVSSYAGRRRPSSEPPEMESMLARSALLTPPPLTVSSASLPGSRKNSIGSRSGLVKMSRRGSLVGGASGEEPANACELYKELGQIDLLTYLVNAFSVVPPAEGQIGGTAKRTVRLSDLLADLIAVHIPVWACVAALHVVLLELIGVKFAFYFYYHEETMAYAALIAAIAFGLAHEFIGGWASNDVLALSSVYVVVSRVQPISYQTGCALTLGLIIFDIFFMYVVDLLSTVTSCTRAPLMIAVPRANDGSKQSIATLDIMAPGVFLNVLLKFTSMYDPKLYRATFVASLAALTLTMAVSIYRRKTTPALVLPLLSIIAVSLSVVDRPDDLWRFMIKH